MPERVVDASVAVKWVMKGESHRRQAHADVHKADYEHPFFLTLFILIGEEGRRQ